MIFHIPHGGCGIPKLFLGIAIGSAAEARVAGGGPCLVFCQSEFLSLNPNHHACRTVLGPTESLVGFDRYLGRCHGTNPQNHEYNQSDH